MKRPWVSSPAYEAAITFLVAARTRAGVSQRALAERLGKSRSYVTKIEARERRLDIVEFVAFARAIGLDPGTLMSNLAQALPDELTF